MTPSQFRTTAEVIAGKHWPTRLGPRIGKCRTQVWEYANGKRKIPATVQLLMEGLMLAKELRKAGYRLQHDGTWTRPIPSPQEDK